MSEQSKRQYWKDVENSRAKGRTKYPKLKAKWLAGDEWAKVIMNNVKACAHVRKQQTEVSITRTDIERLWEEQAGLCYFTGVAMLKVWKSLFSVSVDRLDPTKGYVVGNVVLVTKAANLGKNTHSEEDFCKWIDAVKKAA